MATRFPPEKNKGKGKGGTRNTRYPRIQGQGAEEDSPNPKGGVGKGKTRSEQPYRDFAEKGKCSWGDRCRFTHETPDSSSRSRTGRGDRVMMNKIASKLEARDKKLSSMGIASGNRKARANPRTNPDSEGHDNRVEHDEVRVMHTRVQPGWYKVMNVKTRSRVNRRVHVHRQTKDYKAKLVARAMETSTRTRQRQTHSAVGDVAAVAVTKMTKTKMTKKTNFDQWMAERQVRYDVAPKDRCGMPKMKRGPIVDTAAQISVVNKWDKKYLIKMRRLQQPAVIRAAVGTTSVAEAGTLQVGAIEIN